MGLFYLNESRSQISSCANEGYLSNVHKTQSQTSCSFRRIQI